MDRISLNAYAKINLYLDVTGKRSDGYHLLKTIMHTISIHDTVTLEKGGKGITIHCTDDTIPCDEKNIAYKCADIFFSETNISDRDIHISIEKNIPSQAGMGGGSADGAAVLKGLNLIYKTGLSAEELCALGVKVGADIPFCVMGGCGYCTGIGEIIRPLPPLCGYVLIGKGSEGISTAEAYRKIDERSICTEQNDLFSIFSDTSSLSRIAPYCRNAFDEVTGLREVAALRQLMTENGAICSCMTGSGSAVFGLFEDKAAGKAAENILSEAGYFSRLCEFVKE